MDHYIKKIKDTLSPFASWQVLFLVVVVLFFLFFRSGILSHGLSFSKNSLPLEEPEITQIKATPNLEAQVKIYKSLIERVGPEEAQDDLVKSGLPFTGETHLLNHEVGDYLFDKYGPAGLKYCKEYFLASCYHGFILHAIGSGGMSEVKKTFNECLKSGPTVYGQCAHAIGHGFLANIGYKNLTGALKSCDAVAADIKQFPTFNCYDGVFMENIWGVHEGGEPSPDRWVKPTDLIYPCDDKRIDSKYILACWSNQPSLAYQLLRGDLKKVGEICLSIQDEKNKQMCFDGLSRQIHPMTQGDPQKTFSLCNNMPSKNWYDYCVATNASASYSVGDRTSPFLVCKDTNEDNKSECYNRVFAMMRAYAANTEEFHSLCSKVLEYKWKSVCENF